MDLTQQQLKAVNAISNFIDDEGCSVFILKGYAGTGKTTIIQSLLPIIESRHKSVTLMAPTGRAAKVLAEKTKCSASTIHKGIYSLQSVELSTSNFKGMQVVPSDTQDFDVEDKIHYWFQIKTHRPDYEPSRNVYIIDESSMISSRTNTGENFHFGTDVLLNDLLTYVQPSLGGKIIFVGDPAQLPPVGDNHSAALDENFFKDLNIEVMSFELKEVIRQSENSKILENAMMIRDLLSYQKNERNSLTFERKVGEVEDVLPMQIPSMYCNVCDTPSIGNSIIVCYTNSKVKEYNDAVRSIYFPGKENITEGDILMVSKNIINEKLSLAFFNGDFVKVLKVSEKVEKQSASIWTNCKYEGCKRVIVTLYYRDVTLVSEDGVVHSCKIIDSLLNSREANLTPVQNLAAYINFIMRHNDLKIGSDDFYSALWQDPYLNAIQVKYGYAITGHKSQGGEWKTVFIDYTGRSGLNDDSLRWTYTVTTRASKTVYGVGIPSITPLSKLVIKQIQKMNKPSKEAFSFADIEGLDNILPNAKAFQKQKYMSVKTSLDKIGCIISEVNLLKYNDQYKIVTPSVSIIVNCYYNGAGMYTHYFTDSLNSECKVIEKIFNDDSGLEYNINYTPSSDALKQLYNKLLSLCDDLSITVTNIVEHDQQYYVAYYLKTSARYAQLQFYFKSNGAFSHVFPGSEKGKDDILLNNLINTLK